MAQIDLPYLPPRLYRYRKVSSITLAKRELNAITAGYLWCTVYRKLNDPMEGTYGASERLKGQTTFRDLVSKIRNEKLLVGICCFSDTHNNDLMWAHYADIFSGMCVAYRTSRLLNGLDDSVHIVRMAYGDDRPRIGKAESCPQLAARKILSHKKSCWLYEREWRLLTNSVTVQLPGPLQITEAGVVEAVYLGSRVEPAIKTMLVEGLASINIKTHTMKVSGYKHEFPPLAGALEVQEPQVSATVPA